MALHAVTAAGLVTPNPLSIRRAATVGEAVAFLSARGISAAPVIDEAGRPVGVVSRTDLLNHRTHGGCTCWLPRTRAPGRPPGSARASAVRAGPATRGSAT